MCVQVVWQLTQARAESVSLQQFERQGLHRLSTAWWMVNVWTTHQAWIAPLCCSTACWFKWSSMHYLWRRKCTLTYWSWGAWPLFSAGEKKKNLSAIYVTGVTWPLTCLPVILFPCSHLYACWLKQIGYGFFLHLRLSYTADILFNQSNSSKETHNLKKMSLIFKQNSLLFTSSSYLIVCLMASPAYNPSGVLKIKNIMDSEEYINESLREERKVLKLIITTVMGSK